MTEASGKAEGLLGVRTFFIQVDVLNKTIRFLQEVGADGYEGFVLWAGKMESPDTFRFRTALIPEQDAMMTEGGLLVVVDGEALFNINKDVHQRGEILGAQVHSHPTSAYHSSTDDQYPLVTLLGALSVVLPDFAKNAPSDMKAWAWYRLADYGIWEPAGHNTKVVFE
jgi:hypothetical protein